MLIKDLELMEKIVRKHNNLSWIGWDVVDRKRSDSGKTSVDGVRVHDKWYLQRVYRLNKKGWDIPNKYRV